MSLGQKIQQLRKEKGLSQEQLAESLNVSRQAISKWETDQSSPEIENILAISRVFSVSTDELLGNDIVSHNSKNLSHQAKNFKEKLCGVFNWFGNAAFFKNKAAIFILFSLSCFIAVGVCVIVNFAINQQITWAIYPILSVSFGWLTISPLFIKKHAIMLSLCSVTIFVLPFLYFLAKATTTKNNWFEPIGVPCAIIGIITAWLIFLIFKYVKINLLYKAAITVLLLTVIANPIINHYIDMFLNAPPSLLDFIITGFSGGIVSALLGIWGYMKNKAKAANNDG